jgi:biotin carboxyl carrier protein
MPVDYAGAPCDLDSLAALAAAHRLHIVEDAAHALGATRASRRAGGDAEVACFSFDSIKNITCGEGGAIVCRDGALAERLCEKRQLGVRRASTGAPRGVAFDVVAQGFRYHMSAINAAIGRTQLGKLEKFLERRRAICRRYDDAFRPLGGVRPLAVDYRHAAPHIYVVRVGGGRRDALMRTLRDAEIETARAQLASRQADLNRARARLESTRTEVEAQRRQRSVLDSQEQLLQADLQARRAALELARTNLGYTRIVAPEDGIVGERKVRAGQLVSPGTQVVSLVQRQVWVQANYRETQLRNIREGDRAEIHVDAFPGLALKGKVEIVGLGEGTFTAKRQ